MTIEVPNGYQPLDLRDQAHAGAEVLADAQAIAGGLRTFHGLPFRVACQTGTESPIFVVVEPGDPRIVVPVEGQVGRVIFAHLRLAGSPSALEPAIGSPVAEYTFAVEGRAPIAVPIREGFELSGPARDWDWHSPFLAIGAGSKQPLDRRHGAWDDAGLRQTEIPYRTSETELFLWAWQNPHPAERLSTISFESRGSRVLIAAVTLSNSDEEPFCRDAALPVRITLTGSAHPDGMDHLSVEVDRGVATYVYPLPDRDLDAFFSDPLKGWGEAPDLESPHAYLRVAASPSANLTVGLGDQAQVALPWREVTATGSTQSNGIRVELVEPGRNWVHVRVLDDDSGRPVPCRVHFSSPEGVPYQPHGHHDHVNSDLGTWNIDVGGDLRLGRITYAYIDGTCQGWLPTGDVVVDVARGFEYEPIREPIRIERGQRELELRLKRWTSSNDRGWYSGDSHVHFLSGQGALTEQQGEDLNVVNLLQSQWGSLFTNTEEFTGRPLSTEDGRHVTWVSQENRQHMLGHLVLWGLQRPVMPWSTDGPIEAESGGALEVTESTWADQCHAQGGTVVIPHFPQPNGEPATLIATGRADAVEMIFQHPSFHREYYRYLNCGYRLPLVGGTDKMSSEVPVGLYRTYANLGDEPFSYDAWRRAVVAGRTFLSGGPLLTLDVEGYSIGDTVHINGPGKVAVAATAESVFPFSSLEIVRNGEVVAATAEDGARRLSLADDIRIDGDCWVAARCGGPGHFDGLEHRDVWGRGVFAHTSPVYIATQGAWGMFDAGHARYMLTLIEGSLGYIRERSTRYPGSRVTHFHGEDDHLAYLERPFLEARAELQRRLDDARG